MLTEKGFVRPTYQELLDKRIEQAKKLFGEDIETSEQSVMGKFIRLNVYDLAVVFEQLEKVYLARFPHYATGVSLDRLCPFVGITRNPATAALHSVTLHGAADKTIESGFLVSTEEGITFHTVTDVTLDSEGNGTVNVEANDLGTVGNVPTGSIAEIVNPTPDVESVTHNSIEELAVDEENDVELRTRFDQTQSAQGSSSGDSIAAALMRVQGVESATIVQNNESTEDSEGRPPHSYEVYVTTTTDEHDQEIAEALFAKAPIGITMVGGLAFNVADKAGVLHEVKFSRTEEIRLRIKLVVNVDNGFATDGAAQIKDALVNKASQLANGDDLYLSSLYGVIHGITGVVSVTTLLTSTDGASFTATDVPAEVYQIVKLAGSDIEVSVV